MLPRNEIKSLSSLSCGGDFFRPRLEPETLSVEQEGWVIFSLVEEIERMLTFRLLFSKYAANTFVKIEIFGD